MEYWVLVRNFSIFYFTDRTTVAHNQSAQYPRRIRLRFV